MAEQSIVPFASPHGGTSRSAPFKVAASTSYNTAETCWKKGEVCIVTSGAVGAANAVIADGATNHNPAIHYLACSNSEGELLMRNVASIATTINVLANFTPIMGEQEFMTRNYFTASDTLVVPTVTAVGEICGWWRDNTTTFGTNGRFGLDTGGTGLIVTRVLDANLADIGQTAATGVWVVFKANGE